MTFFPNILFGIFFLTLDIICLFYKLVQHQINYPPEYAGTYLKVMNLFICNNSESLANGQEPDIKLLVHKLDPFGEHRRAKYLKKDRNVIKKDLFNRRITRLTLFDEL